MCNMNKRQLGLNAVRQSKFNCIAHFNNKVPQSALYKAERGKRDRTKKNEKI